MRNIEREERGAALVTVLLFVVLTLTLITSMLTVAGNEIVISSLQRDGVRALELAQAGVQEAVRRIEEGRPYTQGFTSSLNSATTVTLVRRFAGANSAYQEIQATARVGRATRRLSLLALQQMLVFPPNITFANSIVEQGSAEIEDGDIYSRLFIEYHADPLDPDSYTYAGWRISKRPPGAIGPCYDHAQCVTMGQNDWYPAQRRTEPEETAVGADIQAQTTKCPAGGGGSLPSDTITGILASARCPPACVPSTVDVYGFDRDDPAGSPPPQAVSGALPCGLPYKYVSETFQDENGGTVTRIFKTIVFEQWFANYWQFDEAQMTYIKKSGLSTYPQFGAVPPFPDFATVEGNYDRMLTGGGTINSGDFGCYASAMSCSPPVNRPIIVWMDNGDYIINGNLKGHGTIVVDGNLTVNGDFEYWGTIIVNGRLTLGSGNAKIHGGLVAKSTLKLGGNIEIEGGGTFGSVPVGRSVVLGKAWWER